MVVWGCISAAGMGSLEFIEGSMNKYNYINIFKKSKEHFWKIKNFKPL